LLMDHDDTMMAQYFLEEGSIMRRAMSCTRNC